MSVVLIGFMGVGKTSIGNYLGEHYDKPLVDIDTYIVETTKLSIPEIFAKYGESHFRDLEKKSLEEWIYKDVIISTGGGIIESEASRNVMKGNPHNIWLKCDVDTVYERINHDPNRPNANGKSLEDLKSLYSKRESSYNDIAFIHIDADRPKEVVVTEIINSLDKDIFANDQS